MTETERINTTATANNTDLDDKVRLAAYESLEAEKNDNGGEPVTNTDRIAAGLKAQGGN